MGCNVKRSEIAPSNAVIAMFDDEYEEDCLVTCVFNEHGNLVIEISNIGGAADPFKISFERSLMVKLRAQLNNHRIIK